MSRADSPSDVMDVLPGDRVFIYTDGFIEEHDEQGRMFGQQKFEKLISRMLEMEEPLEVLRAALHSYMAGSEQSDDMTMVELIC